MGEDKAHADTVLGKLGSLPPLVHPSEADRLKELLAAAGRGERFLVQGGDCAERFVDCEADRLEAQVKLILQMGMVTEHMTGKPAEVVEGVGEVMSFKGDNINGFDLKDRAWNPERLLQGYFHSAATLNFLRAYTMSADPTALCNIKLSALQSSPNIEAMKSTASEIGAKYTSSAPVEFFTAHEAMQLDLEEALTRPVGDKYYNLSAHLLWIGDRTRQLDHAHVEYFRGISNPIGCKIGPSMKAEELQELVTLLNPNKEEGRLTL